MALSKYLIMHNHIHWPIKVFFFKDLKSVLIIMFQAFLDTNKRRMDTDRTL